jgi:hypothetical protein
MRVLLLGSTPELRSMLAGLPAVEVTVLDRVGAMITAMTRLMTRRPVAETWITGDWLTYDFADQIFDIVLSDLVLGNMPPPTAPKLMDVIRKRLRPEGYWIPRVDCVDEFSVFVELDELIEQYARQPVVTAEELCDLRSAAGIQYWDPESFELCYARLGEALSGRAAAANSEVADLLERLMIICSPFDRPYWLPTREALCAELAERYTVVSEHRDSTPRPYPGRGYYTYLLAPRPTDGAANE